MHKLKPRIHGIIDYLVIAILFLAPSVFGLTGIVAIIAYSLALLHLALTLLTRFSLGIVSAVSLYLHGRIELILSVALITMALLIDFPTETGGRYFFAGLGLVILISWFATNYHHDYSQRA